MSVQLDIELFGKENIPFLTDAMWLDLQDIQSYISKKKCIDKKSYFQNIFNNMVRIYNAFYKHLPYKNIKTRKYLEDIINKKFAKIDKMHNVKDNTAYYKIADVIRHCFLHFCDGGVAQAYTHRETENWYPKIIFKERIESNIDDLDEELTVYRGTRRKEYDAKVYGQSWSLSKEVAHKFAFSQYAHSEEYIGTRRVVLKANILRNDVLFYAKDDQHKEQEVIVESSEIHNIFLLEEKILN